MHGEKLGDISGRCCNAYSMPETGPGGPKGNPAIGLDASSSLTSANGKRTALLVECGQHWLESTVAVAIEVTFRFLLATGAIDQADAAPHLGRPPPPQRVIEVSGPVTIESDEFAFVEDYQGLEIIPEAGTVIGHDGAEPVTTPYDECVLIMPSKRLRRGQTAVRFGRIVG